MRRVGLALMLQSFPARVLAENSAEAAGLEVGDRQPRPPTEVGKEGRGRSLAQPVAKRLAAMYPDCVVWKRATGRQSTCPTLPAIFLRHHLPCGTQRRQPRLRRDSSQLPLCASSRISLLRVLSCHRESERFAHNSPCLVSWHVRNFPIGEFSGHRLLDHIDGILTGRQLAKRDKCKVSRKFLGLVWNKTIRDFDLTSAVLDIGDAAIASG